MAGNRATFLPGEDDKIFPHMNRYEFHLHIRAEKYLAYYRGQVRHVIARCTTGKTVQFPASLLQKFVTKDGVAGDFVLTCDENHKCIELERRI